MGQQQPGRIDRALRAGGPPAVLIDPLGFFGGTPLLGQPPFQPGQAWPQVADLTVVMAQLVQDGGGSSVCPEPTRPSISSGRHKTA